MIAQARRLYADDAFAVDLDNTVYALDTTTIDLSLKVFPWAHFRKAKAAVKMHTQIDLRGNIPSFIHVSDGKMHEVNVLDLMTPEPGSFSIMDRGFLDFARLYRLTQAGAFFVIRPKSNTAFQRVYSRSVEKTTGLRCDQTVRLTGVTSANDHPQYLRYDGKVVLKFACGTSPSSTNAVGRWSSSAKDQAASAHQGVFRHE